MPRKKQSAPACQRTDTGVVALYFDNQEGKYFSYAYPVKLDSLRDSELNDPSPRYELVACVEVSNDDRGFPKPGKLVELDKVKR